MLRDLLNEEGKVTDIQFKVAEDMKRGTVVKKDYATMTLKKATALDNEVFLLDRDVIGDPVLDFMGTLSDYEDVLENVKKDEFAQAILYRKGEMFGTSEYTGEDSDFELEKDKTKYLTVEGGKVKASASNAKTIWVSAGFKNDNGHKLLKVAVMD